MIAPASWTAAALRRFFVAHRKPVKTNESAESRLEWNSMTPVQNELATAALAGLLNEFRHGNIVTRSAEEQGMERHAGPLSAQWNNRFPGFPTECFPYTSFRGEHYRGRRDAYLKNIIVQLLADHAGETTIVNPACVFARHACHLAARLPRVKVIGTDIDPRWFQLYRVRRLGRLPGNFTFVKDNIFAPRLEAQPAAVVFFGACGAVSDGALDYAIASGARYLICRTCCHENIGGNVAVTARPNAVNRFFRFKNWAYGRVKKNPKYAGFYFSSNYAPGAYPRSAAGRRLSNAGEFMTVARNSTDSDICRAIIDLDRCLHLGGHGFRVEYQGELLVAEREAGTEG
jgi:hypothetical protein